MEVKMGVKMDITLLATFTFLPFQAIVQHEVLNFLLNFPYYFLFYSLFEIKQKNRKKPLPFLSSFMMDKWNTYFPWCSSDTLSFLRPFARREASTRRPFLVDILSRKPCLFTLLRLWGWNVLFIIIDDFIVYALEEGLFRPFGVQKYSFLLK